MKRKAINLLVIIAASIAVISFITKKKSPAFEPVSDFDINKYLGTWYEIARFDYRFERNMDHVTATYSLREDGKIKVDNKGFDYKKQQWEESVGKAKVAGNPWVAALKVSFFGPFYAQYNVIRLDQNYQYALVAGDSHDYLWILSRTTSIPEEIRTDYVNYAKQLGFKTDELIWVNQQ